MEIVVKKNKNKTGAISKCVISLIKLYELLNILRKKLFNLSIDTHLRIRFWF
jgi:hypothetical protein